MFQILYSLAFTLLIVLIPIWDPWKTTVIDANAKYEDSDNFRCSHKPQTEMQINHVWLNDTDFSGYFEDNENHSVEHQERSSEKYKRHINDLSMAGMKNLAPSELSDLEKSDQDVPERFATRTAYSDDDFIPMKIEVHYDESVHTLESLKRDLITNKVIPSVVRFFESVLSIRRTHIVDRFRISRRCPNNTVYYVRDNIGSSRAYCMERCEDYAVCGEMIVPTSHLSACSYCNQVTKRCATNLASEGSGVEGAQLLLYVSSKQTPRCKKDQTIAYAAHCAQDTKTDRPVAGHANLCPSSISTDPKDLRALIATVKHELTHVLGFSVSLFAYYRDKFGRPLTQRDGSPGPIPVDPKTGYAKWSDKIIKKFVRTDWVTGDGKVEKEIHMVVTPTVVREVRNHFNCSTLEGAELEDQGSDGTSMTHWEKRLFENEAMTGTHTQNSVYSRITLAVLQDTGWYLANFSRAEKLDWGRELGCDFVKRSCKSWIEDRRAKKMSIRPFCDRVKGDLLQIACTEDRTSKAVCNMKQYKDPLPLAYQNFNHLDGLPEEKLPFYGGSVDLADYCPFIQEFTWQTQNTSARGSRCDQGLVATGIESERNAALEYYGPQTRCIEHERRWEQRSCVYKRHWHHFGAGCYKYTCQDGHFSVLVGNHSYHCYFTDQLVRVEQVVDHWLYNGTLICPPCDKVCQPQKCKSFDRNLIEKILDTNDSYTTKGGKSDQAIFNIMNDCSNYIDDNNLTDSTGVKLLRELAKYRDLVRMISQHEKPPRHSLICSSSYSSMIGPVYLISSLSIFMTIMNSRFAIMYSNS